MKHSQNLPCKKVPFLEPSIFDRRGNTGTELGDILDIIQEKKSDKNAWLKEIEWKWKEILNYNKFREKEEADKRKVKGSFSEAKKKLKRYQEKTKPLTFSDLAKLDHGDKKS